MAAVGFEFKALDSAGGEKNPRARVPDWSIATSTMQEHV